MVNNDSAQDSHGKCCGVVQEATERRARRREKPQPWIVLKMTIGLTLAIIGYTSYVYIGRFCVPLIRENNGPLGFLGGRNIGSTFLYKSQFCLCLPESKVPFLIVFCILLVMMLWAYVLVRCWTSVA